MRTSLLATLAILSGSCSLIDGLTGSSSCDDDLSCFTCQAPSFVFEGNNSIEVCNQNQLFPFTNCGSFDGDDAVFRFDAFVSGDYEVCFNGGISGSLSVSATSCGPDGRQDACLELFSCQTIRADEPSAFLTFRTSFPNDCGNVDISITFLGSSMPEESGLACLDGIDNDEDMDVDCSDEDCRIAGDATCNADSNIELCDGLDNGFTLGFPDLTVDESACRCVNDEGCRGITDPLLGIYLCHESFRGGVCNPPCLATPDNWCLVEGGTCSPDGKCIIP